MYGFPNILRGPVGQAKAKAKAKAKATARSAPPVDADPAEDGARLHRDANGAARLHTDVLFFSKRY